MFRSPRNWISSVSCNLRFALNSKTFWFQILCWLTLVWLQLVANGPTMVRSWLLPEPWTLQEVLKRIRMWCNFILLLVNICGLWKFPENRLLGAFFNFILFWLQVIFEFHSFLNVHSFFLILSSIHFFNFIQFGVSFFFELHSFFEFHSFYSTWVSFIFLYHFADVHGKVDLYEFHYPWIRSFILRIFVRITNGHILLMSLSIATIGQKRKIQLLYFGTIKLEM